MELIDIEGVGSKTLELLNKLNINNVQDLIHYYPFRYDVLKRSEITNLNDGDNIIIDGIVEGQPTTIYLSSKLKKIIFRINTRKTILNVTIYNKTYLYQDLKCGKELTVIGKYDKLKNTVVASDVRFERLPHNPRIEPVYYTTSGLSKKSISKFITSVIRTEYEIEDYIPDSLISKYNFITKRDAIFNIHCPIDILNLKKARQRIKYEELFMYMLKINYLKKQITNDNSAITRKIAKEEVECFIEKLPFKLTLDQNTVVKEIITDLENPIRMNRLLQGDVGSGKTIVAFIAAYANYISGYQTALMAPTEILAKQHFENAKEIFKSYDLKIGLLTSSESKKVKEEIYEDLANGNLDLIIGTQALIQDRVKFNNLGLVITDEQHRFGVNQRNIFKNKGITPDVLSMSATPIPRTYALTIYGDMEVSSIKTKPEGRKEVKTYIKREREMLEILTKMKEELDKKHQIYVIAPQIEDNESGNENIEKLEEKMNTAFGKLYKVATVHGKMEATEKDKVMADFEQGKIDILISTTVIEVGVNVPNASMIVIFNANMFGLSTLHQLRGRVGRSDIESYCILIPKQNADKLKILEKTSDGFEISEYDFQNRGEGDLFGVRQSGEIGLIMANVNKDFKMLIRAKEDADEFIDVLLNSEENEYVSIKNKLYELQNLD